MIRIIQNKDVSALLKRKAARLTQAEEAVRPILEAVRRRGDKALLEYARRFDGFTRTSVRVPAAQLNAAVKRLSPQFRSAVATASANLRAYAQRQMPGLAAHRYHDVPATGRLGVGHRISSGLGEILRRHIL